MRKEIEAVKEEVRLADTIKCLYTYGKLHAFVFERVKIGIEVFWSPRYDAEA